MKKKITARKLVSLLLAVLMLLSVLPAASLGASAASEQNLAAALASAKTYIDRLTINSTTNVPSTVVPTFRTHFSWDHERRENSSSYLYEWSYYNGVVFEGLDDVYDATGETKYSDYVRDYLAGMINESTGAWLKCTNNTSKDAGGYNVNHGLDCYKTASLLLDYYDLTGKQGYLTMAQTLYNDLTVTNASHSVESLGWNYEHTWNTSSYRVWLDGIYMAQPFMAEYAARTKDTAQLDKIASRFAWIGANMVDSDGLYYHAAASRNSTSPSGTYWLRAVGWYAMAMVDVMESLEGVKYDIAPMKAQFKNLVDNMMKVQDPTTHMWKNDIKGQTSSNRLETSGSSMLAYSMMKAVRFGWLDASYADKASDIFVGIVTNKLKNNALTDICFVGAPGSSNSTFYDDEGKGVGPFIMAYAEMLRYANGGEPEQPVTSNVTLNANGGTIASGKNVTSYTEGVGASLPTANDISKAGCRFDGWYANASFSGQAVTLISASDTGDKTFYAKWTDVTAPTGEIVVASNRWNSLLNSITFGLFFKDTQRVTITASDVGGTVSSISYYTANAQTNPAAITGWKSYPGSGFSINPNNNYVIYAKIVDSANNTTYLSSNGIVLDNVSPVITGAENGGAYYGGLNFGVTDANLASVKVDNRTVTNYAIAADNAAHTITAADKAGNSTTITVTVYKNYTVKFVADGQTVDTQTVGYGKDAVAPVIPHKEGFDETAPYWDKAFTNVRSDLTVQAVYTENAPKRTAGVDKTSYATDETITATVKVDFAAEKVYLANENGTGLVSTRECVPNGDGTYTWTLTLSLGSIGSRTLYVYADGESTGLSVSFEVVYPQAAGEPVILSILPPLNIRANEAFTVTFVTNQYTEAVRLFNESGAGLMPSACTYVDSGSNRIWSYTVAVGTSGQRFFTAKAAAADRVYVGDAFVNLFVG